MAGSIWQSLDWNIPVLIIDFFEKRKKLAFHTQLKYKIFLYRIKAESLLHMCVKFYFRRVCGTYKNSNRLDITKLEIFFYHLWNFHSIITNRILLMHFLSKSRSNIYLNKKLVKKRNFQKSFKLFFSETKHFIYVQLFLNSRFSRKLSLKAWSTKLCPHFFAYRIVKVNPVFVANHNLMQKPFPFVSLKKHFTGH